MTTGRPGPSTDRPDRADPAGRTDRPASADPRWVVRAGVVLVCLCGVASAVLELLFVPLYIGSVVVPISVVAAVVGNIALTAWGHTLAGSARGAVAPVVCWLVVLIGLSMYQRPEGDIFVLGVHGEKWNYYALVLFGTLAGFLGIVRVTTRVRPPTR